MIATNYSFVLDPANTEGCEAMGAAIEQRVRAVTIVTIDEDWLVEQFASEGVTLADLVCPSRHVPGIA